MRSTLGKFALAAGFSAILASCSKDDDMPMAPTIDLHELGSDNSKMAYVGADLHIDAEIVAPGNIAGVTVEIHPEGASDWEFDSTYTEGFVGLKNAEFHKHIDIPETAAPGHYHVHFIVTDQQGQRTETDDEIEIIVDPTLPTVEGFEVELNAAGDDLHVEAEITAPNAIARVEIEIHGDWEKDFEYTDAAMVGKTSYHFHKHMNVAEAPAGHYHVHMKVVDQSGKEREFEEHFDKD